MEGEIANSLLDEVRDLNVVNGAIAPSIGNIRKLARITSKLEKIIVSPKYKQLIKELLPVFNEIAKLQNEYFKSIEVSYTSETVSSLIKSYSITDTVNGLSNVGIGGTITKEISEILRSNIATGSSYKGLTKQLKALVLTNQTPGILTRYAGQIVTDSVNQFSATHLQTVSSGLGYTWYSYQGKDIDTTRPFCNYMTDKRFFHVSEIPALLKAEDPMKGGDTMTVWNEVKQVNEDVTLNPKTNLPKGMIAGTDASNFMVRRGGYRCGHQIFPVSELGVPQAIKDAFYAKFPEYKKTRPAAPTPPAEPVPVPVPVASPTAGTIGQQIIELHKQGKTNGQIVRMGYNASTVNAQVNRYRRSLAAPAPAARRVYTDEELHNMSHVQGLTLSKIMAKTGLSSTYIITAINSRVAALAAAPKIKVKLVPVNQENVVPLPKVGKGHNFSTFAEHKKKLLGVDAKRLEKATNDFNAKFHKNLTEEEFISLGGGFVSDNMGALDISFDVNRSNTVEINIGTNKYQANRELHMDLKYVYNDYFRVKGAFQGEGIGTKLLYNQAKAAQKAGFKYLKCDAYRRPDGDDSFNGYYTWPRLGYQMFESGHKNMFKKLINGEAQRGGEPMGQKRVPTTFKDVKDLTELLSTKEGAEFWKKYGFRFDAKFDLTEGSESWLILKANVDSKYGKG